MTRRPRKPLARVLVAVLAMALAIGVYQLLHGLFAHGPEDDHEWLTIVGMIALILVAFPVVGWVVDRVLPREASDREETR